MEPVLIALGGEGSEGIPELRCPEVVGHEIVETMPLAKQLLHVAPELTPINHLDLLTNPIGMVLGTESVVILMGHPAIVTMIMAQTTVEVAGRAGVTLVIPNDPLARTIAASETFLAYPPWRAGFTKVTSILTAAVAAVETIALLVAWRSEALVTEMGEGIMAAMQSSRTAKIIVRGEQVDPVLILRMDLVLTSQTKQNRAAGRLVFESKTVGVLNSRSLAKEKKTRKKLKRLLHLSGVL